MAVLRVGTSGWHYAHWKSVFYPPHVKPEDWLSFYASRFDTVEVNNSFYRLPSRDAFISWREKVPAAFTFAVKASRYITHMKKLQAAGEALANLLDNAGGLGDKLGPVLFQLPPNWKRNPSRLDDFIAMLPAGGRYVFEFRDETWLHDDVYRVLESGNCALCIASSPSYPSAERITADFAFLRFHGGSVPYGSKYPRGELQKWAAFTRSLLQEGRDTYAYFNNDACGYALDDAATFKELVSGSDATNIKEWTS